MAQSKEHENSGVVIAEVTEQFQNQKLAMVKDIQPGSRTWTIAVNIAGPDLHGEISVGWRLAMGRHRWPQPQGEKTFTIVRNDENEEKSHDRIKGRNGLG